MKIRLFKSPKTLQRKSPALTTACFAQFTFTRGPSWRNVGVGRRTDGVFSLAGKRRWTPLAACGPPMGSQRAIQPGVARRGNPKYGTSSVMETTTHPIFALYVMWHPSYQGGREIADQLRTHFGRDLYRSAVDGHGVSVLERSEPPLDAGTPLPIDWDDAEFTAVVVLAEAALVDDGEWASHVRDVAQTARGKGIPAGFFPVIIDSRGFDLALDQQALRWHEWDGSSADRTRRLMSDLTHEFCRMLRHRLDHPASAADGEVPLDRYLDKIQVFLSHSKHDHDNSGESVANGIRDWIHANSLLDSFFDVHDIPPGLPFDEVLLHQITSGGAIVAVHTDSYSSRAWCRREVIEAKRRLVPMIVVDCLQDVDPRGMAYLGNVPIVRMEPGQTDRFAIIASCLLDEIFRTWLWRSRVAPYRSDFPMVLFTARPPELIALAAVPLGDKDSVPTIIYPDPMLSADEEKLFKAISPEVRMQTLTDWLEEPR